MSVTTRFAPSPTGFLHLGNYRTAVFCYLFAKQKGGKFILRIEDTDKERFKPEYAVDILESLAWLKLPYDEFYTQSDRLERHTELLEKLVTEGTAYISEEESKQKPGETVSLVRLKNPNKKVTFTDLIRGDITTDTTDLGDFVIARNIKDPLYHFAVVVDDMDMGVTHIVRGDDHISNTPRHILIQEALGAPRPEYAHVSLVLASDRSKLSKRKGALSIRECRELGYIPEAVINTLALVGWNPGTEQEIFSLPELIDHFSFAKVQKGGAILNMEKLNWMNREYIRQMSREEQLKGVRPFVPQGIDDTLLEKLLPLLLDRIDTWADATALFAAREFDYFFVEPTVSIEKVPWKTDAPAITHELLTEVLKRLQNIPAENWSTEMVKNALWPFAEEKGKGNVLWPMRMALTGQDKSPDPFTVAGILGREKTITRIEDVLTKLIQ